MPNVLTLIACAAIHGVTGTHFHAQGRVVEWLVVGQCYLG